MVKITEAKKKQVIISLAQGQTIRQAAKQAGIGRSSAAGLKPQADIIKKTVSDKLVDSIVNDSVAMVNAMRKPIMDAIKAITPEAIAKQSASANATSAAILIDKIQLLTGGATDVIEIRDSQALVDNLRRKYSAKLQEKT
jgi:hypothetical protein